MAVAIRISPCTQLAEIWPWLPTPPLSLLTTWVCARAIRPAWARPYVRRRSALRRHRRAPSFIPEAAAASRLPVRTALSEPWPPSISATLGRGRGLPPPSRFIRVRRNRSLSGEWQPAQRPKGKRDAMPLFCRDGIEQKPHIRRAIGGRMRVRPLRALAHGFRAGCRLRHPFLRYGPPIPRTCRRPPLRLVFRRLTFDIEDLTSCGRRPLSLRCS